MPEWIALGVVGIVAATSAYWYLQFRKVLPLEKELRMSQRNTAVFAEFSQEMLRAHRLPTTPQSFSDSVQYAVDRFLFRCSGLHVFIWVRHSAIGSFPENKGELICRTGLLENLETADLNLPEEVWKKIFETRNGAAFNGDAPAPFDKILSAVGGPSARFLPWGTPDKFWGILGVIEEDSAQPVPECRMHGLDVLSAYFGSVAERAAQLWELNKAREQLEGGLSVTMARLDETNTKLIERAKEMRTLEEITDAITEQPDHSNALNSIVSIVARSLSADLCAFLLLDEKTGELVTQSGAFGIATDEGSLYRISLKNDEASSVRVFMTGKPFMTGDAQNDPQVIAQFARLWKCHSLLVVPLSVEKRRIGVMRVGSFKRDYFTPDHLKFVRVIAEEAAVLVESTVLSEKLADTNRELAQLHSLKDDFVSTVSHEFKTPLTSIKGFLAVLLEQEAGPLTKEQKRFLKIVMSAAERLGHLVNDMLDMSRLEGGMDIELSPVDLEQVARDSVENHRFLADNKGIRLLLEVPPLLPPGRGNVEWLKHVFDNLVSNALKFTPERGEVTVTLSNKGDCVMASVSDSGIGIPEEDQERIFEKFYRASNRQSIKVSGTGLGLAICKSIVDKHEGRIWFDTKMDEGSTFHFVVPVAEKSAPVAAGSKV
jgi:signal transduction histidine kinase